ncbi:hypothetical protein MLD38_009379 [Melastoma candidum]|uniref:Uncharacterized protein n=1 Tax=Melastoma candidum TaxID=119954 RepID=A0ACB9S1Q2_9MYRT|nr:hypothetical protein MLD38_009379 [Melastoma candidum]
MKGKVNSVGGGEAERRSAPMKLMKICFSVTLILSLTLRASSASSESAGGLRALRSIKEVSKGSNATYECSPSGACVPCEYHEKKDMKYRCSETGYHIPLKCIGKAEAASGSAGTNSKSRDLQGSKSNSDGKMMEYVTYRSCIPAINEEKMTVLGFEVILLCLLVASGSFIYFRRKSSINMPGVGAARSTNTRF